MAAEKADDTTRRETTLLRPPAVHPQASPKRNQGAQTGRLPAPWRLLVQIAGPPQTSVGLEVKSELILGRVDPTADTRPGLDLTPYGGQEAGVSRRHVSITRDDQNQALYVEDLNSTNGTRLNGFWLEAGQRYRLRDGDRLELGDLVLTLRFARSPYPPSR